jgi:NADH:ubiquinone oxidoreductase subunit 3 (subunit A)
MITLLILAGCAFVALGLVFVLSLCLAAARPTPRNTRRYRLGELLSCSHPEWN